MRSTDQMLSRLVAEIEEKQVFIDGVVEDAEKEGRDLNSQEMELATRARTRVGELQPQLDQLLDLRRMGSESRAKIAELAPFMREQAAPPKEIEYRTAGDYSLDMWRAGLGDPAASGRLEIYNRAASHETTADVPGLIPSPIVGPVVNFIDASRPLVTALGPRQLPGQNWSRPKVTQHTTVGLQAVEKTELTSQKMVISKLSGVAQVWGGYVNVSRSSIDFTQPGVLDIIIQDLAGQYAIQTEAAAATAFAAAATAGTVLPTGANTSDQVAGALWAAAAQIYAGTKGIGSVFAVVPPGLLGAWGSLFAPYGPMNQQGQGFSAANFSTGLAGVIAGIPVYVSTAITANTALVLSSAAAECYEERIGALQVVEPSVLGLQISYAGYFTPMVIEATGIVKIVKTP